MGAFEVIRVLRGDIRDLQRIISADEAILEIEKSPEKRRLLHREIGDLEEKIERLEQSIKLMESNGS